MARYLTSPTQLRDLYQTMMVASDNVHAEEQAAHEKLHESGVEHDEENFVSFNPDACYVCALANDFSGGDEDQTEEGSALGDVVKAVMTNVAGPQGMLLALRIAPALALFISLGYLAGRDAEAAGLPDPRKVITAEESPAIEREHEAGAASENTAA